MEKYVVSRELAEKLKAAGFPQTTKFYWYSQGPNKYLADLSSYPDVVSEYDYNEAFAYIKNRICAAPMTDELLEQLPDYVKVFRRNQRDVPRMTAGVISPNVNNPKYVNGHVWECADSPADALAQLWLWCKESGHLNQLKEQ